MINLFIPKLSECLMGSNDMIPIVFDCIDNIVISHASFDDVVVNIVCTPISTINHKIEPF